MIHFISALLLVASASSDLSIDPQLLGGSDANIADFPFMLSVETDLYGHVGGAVIISPDWALTDAWCLLPPVNISRHLIRSGSALLGNGTSHNILQWIHHPLNDLVNNVYDFALAQVDPPFEFGENVAAVALPSLNQSTPDGARALIAGWGTVYGSTDWTTNHLQIANTTVFGDAKCSDYLGLDYADSKLCAQDPNGVVAHCWYDEGGPLVVDGVVFGIALAPIYCNDPQAVQLYSRVASVRDWIDSTIATT